MSKYLRPAYGIYAVRGRLPDGRLLDGVANLGIRPMFDPPKELLEPYFFDFSENLYGQMVEVQFIAFLRPEAKFETMDELIAQIDRDCEDARQILAATRSEEHTSELQSLMRISYAVFCLKKKNKTNIKKYHKKKS